MASGGTVVCPNEFSGADSDDLDIFGRLAETYVRAEWLWVVVASCWLLGGRRSSGGLLDGWADGWDGGLCGWGLWTAESTVASSMVVPPVNITSCACRQSPVPRCPFPPPSLPCADNIVLPAWREATQARGSGTRRRVLLPQPPTTTAHTTLPPTNLLRMVKRRGPHHQLNLSITALPPSLPPSPIWKGR